ncbi:MAG: hypothetical protein ACE5DT_05430 [Nitrosopumilus sp.]
MKSLIIFGILMSIVLIPGIISTVEAHPHATIDLMESHSHDIGDENFQEEFILHDFEHVIISAFDWFNRILFG